MIIIVHPKLELWMESKGEKNSMIIIVHPKLELWMESKGKKNSNLQVNNQTKKRQGH